MSTAVAFTVFGFEVLWYGLVYSLGFLFSYLYYIKFFKHSQLSEDQKDTSFFILVFFSLIVARLAFCFFYFPMYYLQNPLEVLKIYEGGMSIHGGFIGFFLGCWIVRKKYNVSVYSISDFFALPSILALSVGRVGNFMNQELVGTPTNSGIGIVFPQYDDVARHPYQLYASFKNLVVFQIMLYVYIFKQLKAGVMTLSILFLYSIGRFFLDFVREPTTLVFNFPLGQWISIIIMIITGYLLYQIYKDGVRGFTLHEGEQHHNSNTKESRKQQQKQHISNTVKHNKKRNNK
ncbi:MAG: prolipoprotein diacylglyceryl transferase [Candidatus Nanoarchaeia archaeon]